MATCPARYCVFSDSDVEYLGAGWLDDLVGATAASGAALTCARMQWPPPEFNHPTTGAARRLAPRPTPWLFLLDLDQVRGRVDASFRYRDEVDPDAYGGKVAYDVGAAYFAELCRVGLAWTEMPEAFQAKFRHYGGLTWLKASAKAVAGGSGPSSSRRPGSSAPTSGGPAPAAGAQPRRPLVARPIALLVHRAQATPGERRACDHARSRPRPRRRGPGPASSRRAASTVAASCAASPGGTTQPVPSSRIVSPSAPTSETTTGSRCPYASWSTALCDAKLV